MDTSSTAVECIWRDGKHWETLKHLRAQPSLQLLINCRNSDILFTSCQKSLYKIAADILTPWNNPDTEINRLFLIEEGALDIVLEIYTILCQLPWEDRGKLLQIMETTCLFFLWNFSETLYIRQQVVHKGGFNLMLKSLMRYSEEEFLSKYSQDDIFHHATGCLSK